MHTLQLYVCNRLKLDSTKEMEEVEPSFFFHDIYKIIVC